LTRSSRSCVSRTTALSKTLKAAEASLKQVSKTPPRADDPADLVADKGNFSRDVLKDLDGGPWRSRIAEPKRQGLNIWNGDHEARPHGAGPMSGLSPFGPTRCQHRSVWGWCCALKISKRSISPFLRKPLTAG